MTLRFTIREQVPSSGNHMGTDAVPDVPPFRGELHLGNRIHPFPGNTVPESVPVPGTGTVLGTQTRLRPHPPHRPPVPEADNQEQ